LSVLWGLIGVRCRKSGTFYPNLLEISDMSRNEKRTKEREKNIEITFEGERWTTYMIML